jgi:hypothetical protein
VPAPRSALEIPSVALATDRPTLTGSVKADGKIASSTPS